MTFFSKIIFRLLVVFNIISISLAQNPSDIVITQQTNYDQSENSVFIHPINSSKILVSNNTSSNPWNPPNGFGVSAFVSNSFGQVWNGILLLNNSNSDPAVCISELTNRFFINYISASTGYSLTIAYSDDEGNSWSYYDTDFGISYNKDKNHLWIDNSKFKLDGTPNPYYGNLYVGWFQIENGSACSHASANDDQIIFSKSIAVNNGIVWDTPINISSAVNSGCQCQGANIQTGPNGEVYACWAIYDNFFSFPENAIGFNKSLDGGQTWGIANRIQNNIRGLRQAGGAFQIGGGKNMRTNSYPSMTVNQQTGEIYIVWANKGIPGVNTGDADIYMTKSSDQGNTWGTPIRVNQDAIGNGKDQWDTWIACDEITGALVVTYYDSRDFVNNDMANTYISISYDAGATWTDQLISDFSWSGDMIPNSGGYAGDYIGVDFSNGHIVPVWSDDHSGNMLAYTQPFCIPCLSDLTLASATISTAVTHKFYDNITLPTGNNYTITSTGNVELQANTEILIEGEFESQGEFYAHIVSCDNNSGLCKKGQLGSAATNSTVNKPDFPASMLNSPSQYRLFPNPTNGKVAVISNNSNLNSIEILNVLGEQVYKSTNEPFTNSRLTIDLSSHPKGVYFVKVQSGEELSVHKIIYQ